MTAMLGITDRVRTGGVFLASRLATVAAGFGTRRSAAGDYDDQKLGNHR